MILDCIWTLTRLDVIVKPIPQTDGDRKFVCVTSRSCENAVSHNSVTSHTQISDLFEFEGMGLVRITSLSPVSMDLRTRRPAGWHAKN